MREATMLSLKMKNNSNKERTENAITNSYKKKELIRSIFCVKRTFYNYVSQRYNYQVICKIKVV